MPEQWVTYKGKRIKVKTYQRPDGAGNGSYTNAKMPDGTERNLDVHVLSPKIRCGYDSLGRKSGHGCGRSFDRKYGECPHCTAKYG